MHVYFTLLKLNWCDWFHNKTIVQNKSHFRWKHTLFGYFQAAKAGIKNDIKIKLMFLKPSKKGTGIPIVCYGALIVKFSFG